MYDMTKKVSWPEVSVVTPTLNSQRSLELCLSSIVNQDYPGEVEIIVTDAGSSDETLEIAESKGTRIIRNKLKTGEAGKAVGAKYAKGKILAFIDSDNVLPSKDWLQRMVGPFLDSDEIIATEPLHFSYRKRDHWLTRYFALLGMGDPLNLFIGNYDRYSHISDKWTGFNIGTDEKKQYLILHLSDEIPTIGANGFLIRKRELEKYPVKDYLFDMDVLKLLAKDSPIKIAKVKIGIVHLFTGDITTFVRKQKRRIRDFFYFRRSGIRVEETNKMRVFWGVIKFVVATITTVPLLIQMIMGYARKRDHAWFFHPLACWLTLGVYTFESIRSLFVMQQLDRKGWRQ